MRARTPRSVEVEHEELLDQLTRLVETSGDVGAAARTVAEVLRPHFERETILALPPLGALPSLDVARVSGNTREVRDLVHRLRRELPRMLREHRQVGRALERLAASAQRTGNAEGIAFAEKLRLHAEMEEEVLYPTALLIGRFLDEHAARADSSAPRGARRRSGIRRSTRHK